MLPNTNDQEQFSYVLKKAFAETYAFFLKSQYYHWNVEGSNFYSMHKLFGDIYEEVYDSIDVIAEHLRAVDLYVPGSFERLAELSEIKGENTIKSSMQMVQKLSQDSIILINSLSNAAKIAEQANSPSLADYIQTRIDAHNKHLWMLKATLKEND